MKLNNITLKLPSMELSTFSFISMAFVLISITLQAPANTLPNHSEVDLRKSIVKLLRHPELKKSTDENVRISFFVTADKEIVVLKTDARNKELDKFIKTRMNYQKIVVDNLDINRLFHIKVQFNINMEPR